jgi:dipeptidyl aminopeptidase/acylaminoacyl peptidase
MEDEEPSLYKFHFDSLNYSLIWHKDGEGVTELSYSPDRKNIFFVTAKAKGKRGVFPFIDSANAYLLEPDSNIIYNLESFGDGIQLFSYWRSNSSFGIVLNSFDKVHSNTIINHKVEFNTKGMKTFDQKKFYDIIKEGYPSPEVFSNGNFSNGRYVVDTTKNKLTSIFLIDNRNKDTALVTTVKQKLNRMAWSDSGKYLIFSTIDISPGNETIYDKEPNTSKIFVYSLKNKTLLKVFEGSGVKNFFLRKDWIIFDNGFQEKSKIMIYNYINDKMIKEIKVKGGCGLENIPSIPGFSA